MMYGQKMNKHNGLSRYKQKKLIFSFCLDLTATQTAELLRLNRKTVNRYCQLFRQRIFAQQEEEKSQFRGTVEVDESFFGPARVRGRPGPRKRGRGTLKQPVFGVFERGGRVYTELVPNPPRRAGPHLTTGYPGAGGPGQRPDLRRLARVRRPGGFRLCQAPAHQQVQALRQLRRT